MFHFFFRSFSTATTVVQRTGGLLMFFLVDGVELRALLFGEILFPGLDVVARFRIEKSNNDRD